MHGQCNFVLNVGFGRSPTSVFEFGFVKSDSKIASWYRLWPCLLRMQTRKFSKKKKITVHFKLNLKTDSLNRKMLFQIWEAH